MAAIFKLFFVTSRFVVNKPILLLILTVVGTLVFSVASAANNPFAWNLAYGELFRQKGIPENDTVALFFSRSESLGKKSEYAFPKKIFSGLDSANVKVAILIDYQAFWFFGHRVISLYVRKSSSAYVDLYESKSGKVRRRELELPRFDAMSAKIQKMRQMKPTHEHKLEAPKGYVFSGYVGVLSQFQNGRSRQFLLTQEDLLRSDMSPGRVTKVVNPTMGIP